MSEKFGTPAPPPPGLYRWDGQAWRPQPGHSLRNALLFIGAMLAALLIGASLGRVGSSAEPSASATPPPQAATTPAPAPTPLALSGQGSKVVEFDLASGNYRLAWTAQGHDNFIVDLEGDKEANLVNEIPPNPASGETFVRMGGGHYALNVKAATLNWTLTWTKVS